MTTVNRSREGHTGDYRIQFTDFSGRYAATWYGGQQNVATATSVAVVAGMTTSGIDATMSAAGHITGVVTNADHVGLPDIDVSAYQPDGEGGWTYAGWVMTGADGSYDLGGLGSGAYRLEFADYDEGTTSSSTSTTREAWTRRTTSPSPAPPPVASTLRSSVSTSSTPRRPQRL